MYIATYIQYMYASSVMYYYYSHVQCIPLLNLQHTSPMESTEEEIVATNVVGGNANWLSTFSIPG